jgi:hypothetical protein
MHRSRNPRRDELQGMQNVLPCWTVPPRDMQWLNYSRRDRMCGMSDMFLWEVPSQSLQWLQLCGFSHVQAVHRRVLARAVHSRLL